MAAEPEENTANVWVLDTHTKGTGANMVPLDRVLQRRSERVAGFALPERRQPESPPAERKPHRFKLVDLMTRQVIAEDVDARHALDALTKVRSIMDVILYVRVDERERWRRLTFAEAKLLWEQRPLSRANTA